jgi:ABC-type oligopeptide transport system ATPase subunit
MKVSNQEQKQLRLKQFLRILSEDPYLLNQDGLEESRSLSELIMLTGYHPRNEPVNMAEMVSQLLKKVGLEVGSEDMMEHMMNGGTFDDFMKTGNDRQYSHE